jgi:hypothetical protein
VQNTSWMGVVVRRAVCVCLWVVIIQRGAFFGLNDNVCVWQYNDSTDSITHLVRRQLRLGRPHRQLREVLHGVFSVG